MFATDNVHALGCEALVAFPARVTSLTENVLI